MVKLKARLAAIATFIPPGARVADIGTDHGYLPVFLVERGDINYVVAVDVNAKPLDAARELVNRLSLSDKIAVRLGNGLQVLKPEEVDTVVIAGMGASTMVEILSSCQIVTKSLKRLVLQPMVGAGTLRYWLIQNGFYLVDEQLVKDEGRIYEILVAEPGSSSQRDELLLYFGPLLWAKRDPLLKEYWHELLEQLRKVRESLGQSTLGAEHPKLREYTEKITFLEERIVCL